MDKNISIISFADVVHQSISFSPEIEHQRLLLELIDCSWVQRLRDISQTANTRLLYMFSEHSRFGHSIGVAYLANVLLDKLAVHNPREVREYAKAVAAAALLHDIGHLAPGSHTAFKTWFPNGPDEHEAIAQKIICSDSAIHKILLKYGSDLPQKTSAILAEDASVPAWTWEIISGGGWNVDRGNWCIVDSVLSGVNYGRYNIPAITDSIVLTNNGHLALLENRLDAMMHFAVSRHAMYRQMYQHRVLLAADKINMSIAARARELGPDNIFCDQAMRAALLAKSPHDLSIENIDQMREYWWRYHLNRWAAGPDNILADLSRRLLNRDLFKTVRLIDGDPASCQDLIASATKEAAALGLDPRYYVHQVSTLDAHSSDYKQSMLVQMDDGSVKQLHQADPLINSLLKEFKAAQKTWFVLPKELKARLGRQR